MLVSLTRVGAARQSFAKALAVQGTDAGAVMAAAVNRGLPDTGGGALRLERHPRRPELLRLITPMMWLGTRGARGDAFEALGLALRNIDAAARQAGGALTAPGLSLDGQAVSPDGDTHWLATGDPVEQEVLCNLLRRHSPLLIAIAGRGAFLSGGSRDRIGSRWLADSHEHLATRFLASVTEHHLYRVQAELRRRDGISHLDRMDISPAVGADAVLVRCLDAQTSLADTRAHALLLSALAMRARSLVADGRREGHGPQQLLEENRARVISEGLRAALAQDERPRDRERDGGRSRDHERRGQDKRGERKVSARQAVRTLLDDLVPEFSRLDVTPEEILPLLCLVELPGGQPLRAQDLLPRDLGGRRMLAEAVREALTDPRPGGPLLGAVLARYPGSGPLMLKAWAEALDSGLTRQARRDRDRPQNLAGNRPDRQGGRPDRSGKRPDRSGGRPDRSGNRSDRSGNRPDRSGNSPDGSGGRPDRSGGRQDRSGNRPDRSGNNPDRSGNNPDRSGSRPDRSAGRPDRDRRNRPDQQPKKGTGDRPNRGKDRPQP
ncbi:hypothetical protein [Streptomyces sp. NPDC054794]